METNNPVTGTSAPEEPPPTTMTTTVVIGLDSNLTDPFRQTARGAPRNRRSTPLSNRRRSLALERPAARFSGRRLSLSTGIASKLRSSSSLLNNAYIHVQQTTGNNVLNVSAELFPRSPCYRHVTAADDQLLQQTTCIAL